MFLNTDHNSCFFISESVDIKQILKANLTEDTCSLCYELLSGPPVKVDDLRLLTNKICSDLKIRGCRVYLTSLPVILWNRRARAYGIYYSCFCVFTSAKIRLARREWKLKGSPVLKNFQIIGNLLHEITHHIDQEILLLGWAEHDQGFFRRYYDLQNSLGIKNLIHHNKA